MKQYLNGEIVDPPNEIEKIHEDGLEIVTNKSTIHLSINQPIYFSIPNLINKYIVYLMYREDFGFRVGITNKNFQIKNKPTRLSQEKAQKLWVLDICDFLEAKFKEESYSLKFGIPTSVYNGKSRVLNQEYINSIFKEFGKNGFNLLDNKNYKFNDPHVISFSKDYRDYIVLVENSLKGSNYYFESSKENDINLLLKNKISFKKSKNNGIRVRKSSLNNSLLFDEAFSLSNKLDKKLICKINLDKKYYLTKALYLIPGFDLINNLGADRICQIKKSNFYFKPKNKNKSDNIYINNILVRIRNA